MRRGLATHLSEMTPKLQAGPFLVAASQEKGTLLLPSAKPGLPLKEQVPPATPSPAPPPHSSPTAPHRGKTRQRLADWTCPRRLPDWPDNRPIAGVLGSRATFLIGGIIATLCSDGAQCDPCRYRSQNFSLATSEACLGYSSGTRHSGLPTQHTASGSLPRTRPRPGRLRLRQAERLNKVVAAADATDPSTGLAEDGSRGTGPTWENGD